MNGLLNEEGSICKRNERDATLGLHEYYYFLCMYACLWFQGAEFEAKIGKLIELGFSRDAVIQALKLFDGNEEQAAGYLFGG